MGYYGGLVTSGIDRSTNLGQNVAAIGGINGDGVDDFAVGDVRPAPYGLFDEPTAFVIFGEADRFDPVISIFPDNETDTPDIAP